MTAILIKEDSTARRWRAHLLAAQVLRRWPWIVGGVVAFGAALAFHRTKLLSPVLFFASVPGIVNIALLLGYPLVRWIPQRWVLTEKQSRDEEVGRLAQADGRTSLHGSVAPIDVLLGYA